MPSASEKVLKKIEEGKVTPKPRWWFVARRYSVWTVAVVSLVLGSLAFSLILYLLTNQDWNLRPTAGHHFLSWLLLSLPYAWIVFFLLFLAVIYFNFRQFKKGYKYPAYLVIITACVTVVLFGSVAAGLGLHRRLHTLFVNSMPFYQTIFDARVNAWERPQAGFLAGQITAGLDDGFSLRDFRRQDWDVTMNSQTKLEDELELVVGEEVKIIGQEIGPSVFSAQEIRGWERDERPGPNAVPIILQGAPRNFLPAPIFPKRPLWPTPNPTFKAIINLSQ